LLDPRIGLENATVFTIAYMCALAVIGLTLTFVLTRRGLRLGRQKWGIAPVIGMGIGLFAWLVGFNLGAALAAAGIIFLITLGLFEAMDAAQRAIEGTTRRG
jgi:hypothetical protein